jgi:hypothetical protein
VLETASITSSGSIPTLGLCFLVHNRTKMTAGAIPRRPPHLSLLHGSRPVIVVLAQREMFPTT